MTSISNSLAAYKEKLDLAWNSIDQHQIERLEKDLLSTLKKGKSVFICGNGGSATNANHLANDLLYGINPDGKGIKVHSLCANSSINTCLANDTGYENIFCKQLSTLGAKEDLLIALSGSGNSQNIVNALKEARKIGIKTCAMLGFDGGECIKLADTVIHFQIDDMQISEDFQMIIGHILMKLIKIRISSQ
jgi:D-sedoheptulose 7-phosphate isomerase